MRGEELSLPRFIKSSLNATRGLGVIRIAEVGVVDAVPVAIDHVHLLLVGIIIVGGIFEKSVVDALPLHRNPVFLGIRADFAIRVVTLQAVSSGGGRGTGDQRLHIPGGVAAQIEPRNGIVV